MVFSKLLRKGADLYLPITDTGIDAIVRREDGTHLDIQVKSTEAGWSLDAWVPDNPQLLKRRFIVWVDMSKPKENPEIWVFPGETFKDYSIKIGAEQNGTYRRLGTWMQQKKGMTSHVVHCLRNIMRHGS